MQLYYYLYYCHNLRKFKKINFLLLLHFKLLRKDRIQSSTQMQLHDPSVTVSVTFLHYRFLTIGLFMQEKD